MYLAVNLVSFLTVKNLENLSASVILRTLLIYAVRLSVRHTLLILCQKGSTYIVKLSSLPGSPMTLVFWG